MKSINIVLHNEVGLHARPATLFVKIAGCHSSTIDVRNVSKSTKWVNAKSILSLLSIGAEQGQEIEIRVEGEDENTALKALTELVTSNFQ